MRRNRTLAPLALAAALVAAGTVPAEGASVRITGHLTGASASSIGRVMLLERNGRAVSVAPDAGGNFRISASRSAVRNGTLQLIGKNNRYFGPLIVKVDKFKRGSKRSYFGHTTLSGAGVALGRVIVNDGWAVGNANKAGYSQAFISVASNGKPAGAAKAGKVRSRRPSAPKGYKPSGVKVTLSRTAVSVAFANTSDPLATAPTGDPEGDGIPNALDVSDSATGVLDIVNPAITQQQALIPWVDLRMSPGQAKNLHDTAVTRADIAATIGGSSNFLTVAFFIDQQSLTGSNDYHGVDFAYVDCGSLLYCGAMDPTTNPVGPTAYNYWGGTYGPWATTAGTTFGENGVTVPGDMPSMTNSNMNQLSRMLRSDPHCPYSLCPFWVAGMQPRTEGVQDTLATFKPGDIYTVNASSAGAVTSVPMMLSPFAVTVPTIVPASSTNGTTLVGSQLTAGTSGVLDFQFNRPQRLTVAGETGDFMDLGGMHYGFILSRPGHNEFGCAPSFYTTGSGLDQKANYNPTNPADNLWPLTDHNATDLPADGTTAPITMHLDLAGCLATISNDPSQSSATGVLHDGVSRSYTVTLTAAGEFVTGGANRAALGMNLSYAVPMP